MNCFRGRRNQTEDNRKYSEAVRKFSLTMYYHSGHAFRYVRNKFNNTLPHPSTLRKWYANSDISCEQGILTEAIKTLKCLRESLGKTLLISLAFDEMAIKQHIQWLHDQKIFSGFVSHGEPLKDGRLPFAKDALVFMVTVLNAETKSSIPIAYYCVNKLDSRQKSVYLNEILTALFEIDVKVVNITFDGLPANLAMCTLLGASFDSNKPIPYIKHPVDESKVYIFLDACHMLKLLRNTLGDFGTIQYPGHGTIDWKYIDRLVHYQQKEKYVTHRLNKHHILYKKNRMNVRLAAQTYSQSVASSIEYLRKIGNKFYEKSMTTSDFVRRMNRLFDIFNAKTIKEGEPFKSGIHANNARIVFDFFKTTIKYLKALRLRGVLCVNSRRRTGFIGFINNMLSAQQIYEEYVPGELLGLTLFYNSQDVLESFFSRVCKLTYG